MARIWMSGLEAGSVGVFHDSYNAVISAAQARTGSYSVHLNAFAAYVAAALDSAVPELFLRIGLYYTGGPASNDRSFCTLYGAGGELLSFQIRIADRAILVRLGNAVGALIASGGVVPLNAWCCIEIRALVDNAGIVQVKLDGVQIISFSGDTQVGAETTIHGVRWGAPVSVVVGAYTCYGYFDDLVINSTHGTRNNSWPGLGGIVGLVPTGVGNYTQLTPSAGANWAAVDEVPPDDDGTYVEEATVGRRDTYKMQDLPVTSGYTAVVAAMQWLCRAVNTAPGSGNFARLLRVAGVDHQGSDIGYDRTYDYYQEVVEASPATGVAWTESEINSLEAGMVVR